jgi:transposase
MARQVVRAYELPTDIARCDSSSFSVYHQGETEGKSESLIQYGYSKDHRPDLRQYRHALATLDPAGVPLLGATLAGNGDDDSMYYPFWNRLVSVIGHRHFVYIADAKAASYSTRSQLNQAAGIYCFPLPMTGQTPERLHQWVLSPPAQLQSISLPQQSVEEPPVCWGFELSLCHLEAVPDTQRTFGWSERYLVIRSEALAQRQRQGLDQRLEKTQQALDKLVLKAAKDCCVLKNQVQTILKRYRTDDYFITEVQTQQVSQQVGRGRPSQKHPKPQTIIEQFRLQVQRQPETIEQARALCGWRLYVTNATPDQFSLADAVIYYREQWQLERGFHRFKRGQLPALPMFLQDQQRIVGLMFLLTVALRLLTLMEFVVQQQLQTLQLSLEGIYAGNPKRKTERPSAEQLLSAFREITLYFLKDGTVEISPLTLLQQRILALMRVPLSIYQLVSPSQ